MEKTEIPKGGAHVEPGEHLSASTLLTGESFWDEATFREELERFYFRSWLNVGRSYQIPNPGDFLVREIGNESLLFVRGEDREVRGFYNVCRDRGTRIVGVDAGQKLGPLVCPYHAWTYSVEGRLVGAPHTEPLVDFRKEDYGLRSFRIGTWADSSGRIWTIGHQTSPRKWVNFSPGFEDSRSRISASGPARSTRSRRTGKSSGRTTPSVITAPRSTRT